MPLTLVTYGLDNIFLEELNISLVPFIYNRSIRFADKIVEKSNIVAILDMIIVLSTGSEKHQNYIEKEDMKFLLFAFT